MIHEEKRDLFSLDYRNEFSLCHCVSSDLAMGKGIAVLFRNTFGGIEKLRIQNPTVGGCCSLPSERMKIYYLITKPKYWNKPTYESLRDSLQCMRDDLVRSGIRRLGMPRIGCGLDGLEWSKVKDIIESVFKGTEIDIVVCVK